jgi:hypothetical protein
MNNLPVISFLLIKLPLEVASHEKEKQVLESLE